MNPADDPKIKELLDSFALCETWEERYAYVIELGQQLPEYPEELRTSDYIVKGCVSQVWLCEDNGASEDIAQTQSGTRAEHDSEAQPAGDSKSAGEAQSADAIQFLADSDAAIVRGMLAVVLGLVNGRPAAAVANMDIARVFSDIGLDSHLTSQRANGLNSMISYVKALAQRNVEAS